MANFEQYAKVVMVGATGRDANLVGTVQRAAPGIPGMWEIRWPGGLACQSATGLKIVTESEAARLRARLNA